MLAWQSVCDKSEVLKGGHFCHGGFGTDKLHDLRICTRIDVPPEWHSGQPELARVLRASLNLLVGLATMNDEGSVVFLLPRLA
jgi:hypothetical protein